MSIDGDLYIGRRLSFDGALCTVRCLVDQIPGATGEWIGVEWDDPSRGKHDGTYRGVRYFHCLSSKSTVASFVRRTRRPDCERTVLEAIKFKYAATDSHAAVQDTVVISGKVAEEIGFDKINQQQSTLSNLKIVILDHLTISGVAPRGSSDTIVTQSCRKLTQTCPIITELDLGHNPVERLKDVYNVCFAFPKLRVLKLNSIRFRDLNREDIDVANNCFRNLQELHLNECILKPAQVLSILASPLGSYFPNLKSLWLSQNELDGFTTNGTDSGIILDTIEILMLENNHFVTLDPLVDLYGTFSNVSHVSLQANQISSFGKTLLSDSQTYSSLTSLNLSSNNIRSFTFVDGLPKRFPCLSQLRLSRNPFYDYSQLDTPAQSTEKSYYLTLARIPNLKSLNYTEITRRDREEGEIYYLSIAESDIRSTLRNIDSKSLSHTSQQLTREYPQYSILCLKHDREDLIKQISATTTSDTRNGELVLKPAEKVYPPGTLVSRLISTTFYLYTPATPTTTSVPQLNPPGKTHHDKTFTRAIPSTIYTTAIFSVVSREFNLQPLTFNLVYESIELDPAREDTTTHSQLHTSTGNAGDKKSQKTRWDDWGDWDADIVVAKSIEKLKKRKRRTERKQSRDEDTVPEGGEDDDEGEKEGETQQNDEGRWTEDGVLIKNGRKWRRREIPILPGMRNWGSWMETGVKTCTVRVEVVERKKWVSSSTLAA